MFSETKVCLHDEIRRNSNKLRSFNGGGLSSIEKEGFLSINRSSCAAKQFRSEAGMELVNRRAPNHSKHRQWTTEVDVSA
ncbi:hypothetical protein TNCV_4640481 [Trichonephila clavipes]|nr:hypothetical protein TNCV_4640481 [Trichonephila clavipes]